MTGFALMGTRSVVVGSPNAALRPAPGRAPPRWSFEFVTNSFLTTFWRGATCNRENQPVTILLHFLNLTVTQQSSHVAPNTCDFFPSSEGTQVGNCIHHEANFVAPDLQIGTTHHRR